MKRIFSILGILLLAVSMVIAYPLVDEDYLDDLRGQEGPGSMSCELDVSYETDTEVVCTHNENGMRLKKSKAFIPEDLDSFIPICTEEQIEDTPQGNTLPCNVQVDDYISDSERWTGFEVNVLMSCVRGIAGIDSEGIYCN